MTVYYVLYALLLGNLILTKKYSKKKYRIISILLTTLPITLVIALRHPSMGVDLGDGRTFGYLYSFSVISQYTIKELILLKSFLNYEKGYLLLNKLIGEIYNNPQFFLAVCALITFALIGISVYKLSCDYAMSYIVYLGLPCFLINYSGLRQSLAIGIIALSYCFIKEKKLFQFIISVLFASAFHFSAFVFLLAYPLYHMKKNTVIRLASVLALSIVYISRYDIFRILSRLFKENAVPDNNSSVILFIAFTAVYTILILFESNNDETNGYINIFYLACFCQAMGGVYSIVIRVGYYFLI
jgi:hypothetical protein